MNKKELLQLRHLLATPKMIKAAKDDIPQKQSRAERWSYSQQASRKYNLYLRCHVEKGILEVALYYPDSLRSEGRMPTYTVYIDREARKFITYDCINGKWLTAKVNRLQWPHFISWYPCVWASEKDSKAVGRYLGSDKTGYEAIFEYQQVLRLEALEERHWRETSKWDADLAPTPSLPKDWGHWLDKVGVPQNFIFYEYRKGGAKTGYCTYCGKDVPLKDVPRHNKAGRCPRCRHETTYKSIGKLGRCLTTDEACAYLIQPMPDGFIVREFWVQRSYLKNALYQPNIHCAEHWRVIYDRELSPRIYYWGLYRNSLKRWIAGLPSCSWMSPNCIYATHGNRPGQVYGKTLPHLAGDALKRTGLVEWLRARGFHGNPDTYLTVIRKYPRFEQLWKANLPRLTEECWNERYRMDGVFLCAQAPSLTKSLGIDKQELARLRVLNGGRLILSWLQEEKASGKPIPDGSLRWLDKCGIKPDDLSFILQKMSVPQICHYLERQAHDSRDSVKQVLSTWQDYLSMAERLGMDTDDEIIYRVRLLRKRHDELVLRCKRADSGKQAEEVLKSHPHLNDICKTLKAKYEYANGDFAVVAPRDALDIIVEGEMLCHCLHSSDRYWDRIETHESYILFLRRASDPDMPYYTLEVEPDGTVRQKRTKYDRQNADIEEAKKFLTEWQSVIKKRLSGSDRRKAKKSRSLREQEFAQMRQDNVIINTGEMSGHRLVDVLTADLMEAA